MPGVVPKPRDSASTTRARAMREIEDHSQALGASEMAQPRDREPVKGHENRLQTRSVSLTGGTPSGAVRTKIVSHASGAVCLFVYLFIYL